MKDNLIIIVPNFPSGDKVRFFFTKNFHQKHKEKCIFEGKEDRYQ